MKRQITFKQLKAIYSDESRLKDYEAGKLGAFRAAAGFISRFDAQIDHPYRMGDCLLAKFNLIKGKPRKKRAKRNG